MKTNLDNKIRNSAMDTVIKYINSLDMHITKKFKDCKIEMRPVRSNGLWCCTLLPAILVMYTCFLNVSLLYSLVAYISVSILIYSILFIIFLTISATVLKDKHYGGCEVSSLLGTLLVYSFSEQGIIFSLLFSIPSVLVYATLLRISIMNFPKTFTMGEAMILTQSITLFSLTAVAEIYGVDHSINADEESTLVNVVIFMGLFSVMCILLMLYNLEEKNKTISNLAFIVAGGAVFMLMSMHVILGRYCLFQVIHFVFFVRNRALIFLFWLFLTAVAIIVLLVRTKIAVKATTVTRKSFHVLASMVFLSGILYDPELMKLAAGFGLALLLLAEALRKSKIEPISSALQSAFDVYSDEKDCGSLAMTPMYLFAGLACPLVLVPPHSGASLELLSGVLATGVGDSAASWFGSRWGTRKWPGGNRTLEGTAFNILTQVLFVYMLDLFELVRSERSVFRTTVAATFSSLVEANTDQVDNLVLPLTTLLAFQATWFLC